MLLGHRARADAAPSAAYFSHRYPAPFELAKFGPNRSPRDFLPGTGDQVLVEASPVDPVWGIAIAVGDPRAQDPTRWQGHNLLVFALTVVRDTLGEQA